MHQLTGGTIARGIVDYFPAPPEPVVVDLSVAGVERLLGIELSSGEIQGILEALEFKVEGAGDGTLQATVPDYRMDISTGVVGQADLTEEVARIYGYDRIPFKRSRLATCWSRPGCRRQSPTG